MQTGKKTTISKQSMLICLSLCFVLSACLYTVEETPLQELQVSADTLISRSSPTLAATDSFLKMLDSLERLGFYMQKQTCAFPLDSAYCCLIPPLKNTINNRITLANQLFLSAQNTAGGMALQPVKKQMQLMNMQGLLEIKNCLLATSLNTSQDAMAGAAIEEWIFDSKESSRLVSEQLRGLEKEEWRLLSQAPISWWRKKNRLYFIFPTLELPQTDAARLKKGFQDQLRRWH